jgi:hypothetical protein
MQQNELKNQINVRRRLRKRKKIKTTNSRDFDSPPFEAEYITKTTPIKTIMRKDTEEVNLVISAATLDTNELSWADSSSK